LDFLLHPCAELPAEVIEALFRPARSSPAYRASDLLGYRAVASRCHASQNGVTESPAVAGLSLPIRLTLRPGYDETGTVIVSDTFPSSNRVSVASPNVTSTMFGVH
jgi:hypothetical protein